MMRPATPVNFSAPLEGCQWRGVVTRLTACPALPDTVLLHAGPPFTGVVPAPVRDAAEQALVFEGLASDLPAAADLLDSGAVKLAPAQDHQVVTPLAQVVSASMPLAVVSCGDVVRYAPLTEGPAPAVRFGNRCEETTERFTTLRRIGLEGLHPLLVATPLPMAPIIDAAIEAGEEAHALTGAATQALLACLEKHDGEQRLSDDALAVLQSNPAFSLTIMMAAAACALAGGEVVAAGGNGVDMGLRLRGEQRWRRHPATPPEGKRFDDAAPRTALGAIGDSAVLDMAGLGGQALLIAPALLSEWQAALPPDAASRREQVVDAATGLVSPGVIQRSGIGPLINLAILANDTQGGLIGRGCYAMPASLFSASGAP